MRNKELTIVKTNDVMMTVNAIECGLDYNVSVQLGKGFDEMSQYDELCLKVGRQIHARGNGCDCHDTKKEPSQSIIYPAHLVANIVGDDNPVFGKQSADIIKESTGEFETSYQTNVTKVIRRGMAQIFSESDGDTVSLLSTPNYAFSVGLGFSGHADVIIDIDELSPELKPESKELLRFFTDEIQSAGLKRTLNSAFTIMENNKKHRFSVIALDERFLAPDLQELKSLYDESADLLPSEFVPVYVLICEIPNRQQPDTKQGTVH